MILYFSEAILCVKNGFAFYCNRSYAYSLLGNNNYYMKAIHDANKCIELIPHHSEGYLLKSKALFELRKYGESINTVTKGLGLCEDTKGLQVL